MKRRRGVSAVFFLADGRFQYYQAHGDGKFSIPCEFLPLLGINAGNQTGTCGV